MADKAKENRLLFILACCSFFVGLDSIVTVPLLPALAQSAAIPMDLGALLVSVYAFVYMVSAPLFGTVSDRRGRKGMIWGGMLVLGLGTMLTGLAESFASLLLFRALTGMGAAMLEPSIFALISDHFPYERRGRAMGVVMGALTGSTLFGVPLGSYLAQFSSWQWTFWCIGLSALLMLFFIHAEIPREQPGKKTGSSPSALSSMLRTAFTTPSLFLALLATLLWFGGLQGMFANIGVYYHSLFQLETGQIGIILMIAGAGSVLGSLAGGKLADSFGKKIVVGFASLFAAAGVGGLSLIDSSLILAVTVHFLWSTAFGMGHTALTALISELSPAVRSTLLSLNSSAMYAGMMLATAVSAALLRGGGFSRVGLFCAASALLVLPVCSLLKLESASAMQQTKANQTR